MAISFTQARVFLNDFTFDKLFVEVLGWSRPTSMKTISFETNGKQYKRQQIAQLAGAIVFEVTSDTGRVPDYKTRQCIHKDISRSHHENLLIFIDSERSQSLWYWVKRQDGKLHPRDHTFFRGQPGDLFLSKLSEMVFDLSDFDETGKVSIVDVTDSLRKALDVERVTKKFYTEFQEQHIGFMELIEGIDNDKDRRWYASVLLNRLMFIYFLQKKFFIDNGDADYLQNKLMQSQKRGKDQFFSHFLKALFFEGFAKPEDQRTPAARKLLGKIKYLNGGLFLPHRVEQQFQGIFVPDKAFENLLALFARYSWNLNDTPGGNDNEINPDVLGYIFEKYINQKAFGAYYTRTEITEYLCEKTIHRLILEAVNSPELIKAHDIPGIKSYHYQSVSDLLMDLDVPMCRRLLLDVLPNLTLLDPACGSGAFLVAAMKTLINLYAAIIGKVKFLNDRNLSDWLTKAEREHKSLSYFIKKRIITDNLYGVDIMEEATEIARLRLFLALVASAERVEQLEPLPNIDFNILAGNSLIGLMRVEDQDFERHSQGDLFRKSYHDILLEKNRLIDTYRHATSYADDLTALRDNIQKKKQESLDILDEILLDEFKGLDIKFKQATWDTARGALGKSKRRTLTTNDIRQLRPFHWGYEFDEILNVRGGFDAIITNPPWEIFKPIAKEFCYEYDPEIERRGTDIKDFEKRLSQLLKRPQVRQKYLEYLSRFPHVSSFFRSAPQFKNQISIVKGKRAGTDINLYKLFTEQCFNLLRDGGFCGIVCPSGIYSDLGAKQLRELLFTKNQVTGLFCFENRREIFEGVHRSYKFLVLTYKKGGVTRSFPAAFMCHDVTELERFPQEGAVPISIDFVRRLSPDSLSVMEFKSPLDVTIVEKMLKFPLLGKEIQNSWSLRLTRELDMTNDAPFFKTRPSKSRLPLYEGKMIWHFQNGLSAFRYWVDEEEAAEALRSGVLKRIRKLLRENGLPENVDGDEIGLDYKHYRLGIRAVTGATNERALVATIIPKNVFAGNSLLLSVPTTLAVSEGRWKQVPNYSSQQLVVSCALLASFPSDWFIRQKILTNMNMFYVYEIPVPRLTKEDVVFQGIMHRSAQLLCTTPEFDDLAKEVGLGSHKKGATAPEERARLRAELDGLIANLYGLTQEEFAHILSTFPIVPDAEKQAAMQAFTKFAPKREVQQLTTIIQGGEKTTIEFKSSARWDMKENKINKALEQTIVKTVAAFLNSEKGGSLLIGVGDSGEIIGLKNDYKTLGKKNRDGYENFLTTMLLGQFGKNCAPLIELSFNDLSGQDVCWVKTKPSPKPVFVKDGYAEHLYIRAGNSTRQLSTKEAIDYCKQRWG